MHLHSLNLSGFKREPMGDELDPSPHDLHIESFQPHGYFPTNKANVISMLSMSALLQIYSSWWLLASAAVAIYIARKVQAYQRLSAFNGPLGVGFTNFSHSWAFLTWRSHLWYKEVCDKYGKLDCASLVNATQSINAEERSRRNRASWSQ